MSLTTLTLLTEGTAWAGLRPKWFQVTFTEDTSIARVDFYDSTGVVLDSLLNVTSDTPYEVQINSDLYKIIFTPDSAETEKHLRITNIRWDMQYLLLFDPDKTVIFYDDGRRVESLFTFEGVTFTNGVGTGFTDLVVGNMLGLAVFSKGSLLGYITANTATTITLSTEYSSIGPIDIWITYPFGSRILTTAGVETTTHPDAWPVSSDASTMQSVYPPYPFVVDINATERTSNVPVSEYVSAYIHQTGLPYEV